MSTTLITLGVVVALLAVALTPGFLDFSSLLHHAIGELPTEPALTVTSLEEAGQKSADVFASLFRKVTIAR